MIAGIFHQGSGLGNQLHRYVMTRVLALDKGCEWGMLGKEDFKGKTFMNLELPDGVWLKEPIVFNEKKVVDNGVDIRGYDPEINFVEDNTVIDGEFQDERYFEHRLKEIDEWLTVDPIELDDICVIGFRGREFTLFPDLFLTKDYWDEAIRIVKEKHPNIKFQVHTDDVKTAREFFPDYECIHDIGLNWRSVRYAHCAIIANSSFYILPRLLNGDFTIAPRFWARRNIKIWALPQNYYKKFTYI